MACFKDFQDGNKCSGDIIECQDCNRSFFGKECFNEHKRNRAEVEKIEYFEENGIIFEKNLNNNKISPLSNRDLEVYENSSNLDEFKKNMIKIHEHQRGYNVVCEKVKKCHTCKQYSKRYVRLSEHICGYSKCSNCKDVL